MCQWMEGSHCTGLYFQALCVLHPNLSESIKHKLWDCIHAWRAWLWTTFIMHEVCGVRIGKYVSFHWKQALFGERIPKKFMKIKIRHLHHMITLWTIWIDGNDKANMNARLNISAGATLLCTQRQLRSVCSNLFTLSHFWPNLFWNLGR